MNGHMTWGTRENIERENIVIKKQHYWHVTWASWCLKSPANRLFVQQLVRQRKHHTSLSLPCLKGIHFNKTGGFPSQLTRNEENFSISWGFQVIQTYSHSRENTATENRSWDSLISDLWCGNIELDVSESLAPGIPTLWRPGSSHTKIFRVEQARLKTGEKLPIPCKFCTNRFIGYSSNCYGKVRIDPLMANIRNPDFFCLDGGECRLVCCGSAMLSE